MCGRAWPGCGRRGPPSGLRLMRSCRAVGRTSWEREGSALPSHHARLRDISGMGDVRAGAAGLRQTRATFTPVADAVLPRCRPHFLEGRAAPSPPITRVCANQVQT